MSFRRDLETWTANQVAVRALSDQAKAIRRLLRGNDGGVLGPIGNQSQGLPGELREVYPPGLEVTPPSTSGAIWVCWPSADGAVYGWGDPYENPPGTPVNPPLGTIQTSYSDTARIAREIDGSDTVTHGVNKIGSLRDWRDDASPLTVSWDESGIYSNGQIVLSGSSIQAACVRYSGPTPHLLWLESQSTPDRIWSQECTISDDAVTGLIGTAVFDEIDRSDFYWCEFSQDGDSLLLCVGASVDLHTAYELSVPASLTGAALTSAEVAGAGTETINWTSVWDFNGECEYLVKSQYVDNVITHIFIKVNIEYIDTETREPDQPIAAGKYDCNTCGTVQRAAVRATPAALWEKRLFERRFKSTVFVKIGGTEVYSVDPSFDERLTHRWDVKYVSNDGEFDRDYPDFPTPTDPAYPGGPWPCHVNVNNMCEPSNVYQAPQILTRLNQYQLMPPSAVDARYSRVSLLDIGSSSDQEITKTQRLRSIIRRNGVEVEQNEIAGKYGWIDWPRKSDINFANDLRNALKNTAKYFCPASDASGNHAVSDGSLRYSGLDLTGSRTVQCLSGLSEDDAQNYYIDHMDGVDIDSILSIDGEPNPRIVIDGSSRYIGLLMQEP